MLRYRKHQLQRRQGIAMAPVGRVDLIAHMAVPIGMAIVADADADFPHRHVIRKDVVVIKGEDDPVSGSKM